MAISYRYPIFPNKATGDIRTSGFERGALKVHIFEGKRIQVDKSKSAPAWMPDKIWKQQVKKVGTEKGVKDQGNREWQAEENLCAQGLPGRGCEALRSSEAP